MKKHLSVFLTAALLFTIILSALGAPAAALKQTATIKAGDKTYTAEIGSYVEYDLSIYYPKSKLASAQVELAVDPSALSGYTQAELDSQKASIAPYTSSSSVLMLSSKSGRLGFDGYVMNFANPSGYSFTSSHVVLTFVFKVEKAGTYDLSARLRYVEDVNGKAIVDSNYNVLDQAFSFTESIEPTNLAIPQLSVTNEPDGLRIRWSKVKGASGYRVFYKGASDWQRLADTKDTSYLDKNVTDGNTYTYTVRCLSSDSSHYVSYFVRDGKKQVFHAAPKLTVSHGEDSVKLSWTTTKGAAKYRIYYFYNGGWKRFKDLVSTSYTDTTLASGYSRTYTVRSLDSKNNFISSYYPGTTIDFHTAPVVNLSLAADGVNVSWANVPGAAGYRVFKYGSSGWTRLADTDATSYIDKNVSSASSYTYTVRCINADGTEYTSDYRAGVSIKYYAAPVLTLSRASNGVSINWNAVTGASKYRLYYMASSGWTKIADITGTSYVDTSIKSGETRTYTMRAMDANNNHLSWYYKEGFTITY